MKDGNKQASKQTNDIIVRGRRKELPTQRKSCDNELFKRNNLYNSNTTSLAYA